LESLKIKNELYKTGGHKGRLRIMRTMYKDRRHCHIMQNAVFEVLIWLIDRLID